MNALKITGQALGVATAITVMLAVSNQSSIKRIVIETKLRSYASAVRQSNVTLADKERLLEVVERLEDRVYNGQRIEWLRWSGHEEAIDQLLKKGINADEVRLIERELQRTEHDLKEAEQ